MTRDWKKIAQGNGLAIPEGDLGRIAPPLDALEAAFRPLVRDLAPEMEPAVVFQVSEEDGE
jgi:hypothetical protein